MPIDRNIFANQIFFKICISIVINHTPWHDKQFNNTGYQIYKKLPLPLKFFLKIFEGKYLNLVRRLDESTSRRNGDKVFDARWLNHKDLAWAWVIIDERKFQQSMIWFQIWRRCKRKVFFVKSEFFGNNLHLFFSEFVCWLFCWLSAENLNQEKNWESSLLNPVPLGKNLSKEDLSHFQRSRFWELRNETFRFEPKFKFTSLVKKFTWIKASKFLHFSTIIASL